MAFMSAGAILTTYLTQWLKTASKGTIVYCYEIGGLTQALFRFKCQTCGQNWNVGQHLFKDNSIPSELQEWVKEHRHACKKYKNSFPGAVHSDCDTCKWPYGAHEESWQPEQKFDPQNFTGLMNWDGTPKKKYAGLIYAQKEPEPIALKPKIVPPLPEVRGRKFRD